MSVILLPPLRTLGVFLWVSGLAFSGCVHPPGFVRKNKVLGPMFHRPDKQPFVDSSHFSFEIDKDWIGPESNKLGVIRYRQSNGRATIDAVYLKTGGKGWVPLTKYYQRMREKGTVEDLHLLEDVKIYARAGKLVRYTTLKYDPEYRTGEKYEAFYAEEMVITDPEGYYVFRYRAEKKYFQKYRDVFNQVLASMVLEERKGEAVIDVFAGTRKKKSVSDTMEINRMEADEKFRKKRWQVGLQLGLARPYVEKAVAGSEEPFGRANSLNLSAIYYPTHRVGFGGELAYHAFAQNSFATGGTVPVKVATEGTITVVSIVARANLHRKARINPYILAGFGYHMFTAKITEDETASDLKSAGLTGTLGIGVERSLPKNISVSIETRVQVLNLDGKQLSGNLGMITGLLGVRYRFGK